MSSFAKCAAAAALLLSTSSLAIAHGGAGGAGGGHAGSPAAAHGAAFSAHAGGAAFSHGSFGAHAPFAVSSRRASGFHPFVGFLHESERGAARGFRRVGGRRRSAGWLVGGDGPSVDPTGYNGACNGPRVYDLSASGRGQLPIVIYGIAPPCEGSDQGSSGPAVYRLQ